jgi:hypothetical protein
MEDKKVKFHAVNKAAVTQFNKALEEEARKHPNIFLLDEVGHWEPYKANYIAGIDPYEKEGKGSISIWSTIKIKKDGD